MLLLPPIAVSSLPLLLRTAPRYCCYSYCHHRCPQGMARPTLQKMAEARE